jgi:hypothetical protein
VNWLRESCANIARHNQAPQFDDKKVALSLTG